MHPDRSNLASPRQYENLPFFKWASQQPPDPSPIRFIIGIFKSAFSWPTHTWFKIMSNATTGDDSQRVIASLTNLMIAEGTVATLIAASFIAYVLSAPRYDPLKPPDWLDSAVLFLSGTTFICEFFFVVLNLTVVVPLLLGLHAEEQLHRLAKYQEAHAWNIFLLLAGLYCAFGATVLGRLAVFYAARTFRHGMISPTS